MRKRPKRPRGGSFAAPVLLVHGTFDQTVSVQHSQLMKARLEAAGKPVRYIELSGVDHPIANDAKRGSMLLEIDRFLAASFKR